jgi:metal transporter CNNM
MGKLPQQQQQQQRRGIVSLLLIVSVLLLLLIASVGVAPSHVPSAYASKNHDFDPLDLARRARQNLLRGSNEGPAAWAAAGGRETSLAAPVRRLQDTASGSNATTDLDSCNFTCCSDLKDAICPPASAADSSSSSSSSNVESTNPFTSVPSWAQYVLIIALLMLSALFSGLTLGLLSLDKTGLEVVMSGDDPVNSRYAKRIYPIRENGNRLLCTLVLGNVGVNSLLSILMADKAGGLVGFLVSTFSIVIFGEIIPQSVCSLHALRIGSATAPVVRVMMILLAPIAYPLGYTMDLVLGEELVRSYSSGEMLKLLQIQVEAKRMDPDTASAMTGALLYKTIAVANVMTPIENTFMLEVDDRLSFETVAKIFKAGYSRIPVYEIDRNHVIGLLFVKDLIFIDPEDNTRVGDFVEIFGRSLHVVWSDDKLGDVLRELKSGRSHMALVRDVNNSSDTADPFYELKGIITLEDIIEEIIGDEIVDETDAYVDSSQSVLVDRPELTRRWASLRLLDAKIVDETLTFDEARAMAAHLSKNYGYLVELISDNQLHKLLAETPVSVLPTADKTAGQLLPDDLMYEKGVRTDVCTLIMSGKVTVIAGDDNFRSDVSSWSMLAAGALGGSSYVPDFSAYVSHGPCRCLRLSRARFSAAVDASALERHAQQQSQGKTTTTTASSALSSPSTFLQETFGRRGRAPVVPPDSPRNPSLSPPPSPKPHVHRHTGILAALKKVEATSEPQATPNAGKPATAKGKAVTFKASSSSLSDAASTSEPSLGGSNIRQPDASTDEPHNPVNTKNLLASSYEETDDEKDNDT